MVQTAEKKAAKAKRDAAYAARTPEQKAAQATYDRAYRTAHADELNAKDRSRNAANRDKVRTYFAEYCASHRTAIRAYGRAYWATRRATRRALVYEGSCVDCGATSSTGRRASLERDHRPGTVKLFNVADGMLRSEAVFWAEVAKTDLVCKDCHWIRTLARRKAA